MISTVIELWLHFSHELTRSRPVFSITIVLKVRTAMFSHLQMCFFVQTLAMKKGADVVIPCRRLKPRRLPCANIAPPRLLTPTAHDGVHYEPRDRKLQ